MNPLVSIVVTTYNSSKYVFEALESTKEQTYQNIELIITDDCSTDNTVEICEKWMKENENRFVRIELIRAEKNTGIPANCNRGYKSAKGTWIMGLAGDDALKNDCIYTFVNFINDNRLLNPQCIVGKQQCYYSDFRDENKADVKINNYKKNIFYSNSISAKEQLEQLQYYHIDIPAPSSFTSKNALESIGYFDEKYFFLEDKPAFYKIIEKGNKIHFIENIVVKYRIHNESIMRIDKGLIRRYIIDRNNFYEDYVYKSAPIIAKINILWFSYLSNFIIKIGNNGLIAYYLYRFMYKYNTSRILLALKRKIRNFKICKNN